MSMSREQEERVHHALSVLVDSTPSGVEFEDLGDVELTARTNGRFRLTGAWAFAAAFVLVIVSGGLSMWAAGLGQPSEPADGDLITSEQILADGVVTEGEYRAAAHAVVACLAAAGFDGEVDFDGVDLGSVNTLNGHASFSNYSGDEPGASTEAFNQCSELHLSNNVSLGWAVALGQLDLNQLRVETTAVTECVEQATGQEFGELTFDEFGYLTTSGQQTKDLAFEYQDHEPWMRCQNDLGYLEDYKAETRAVFECVEKETGEDLGDLAFNELGMLTEESEQAWREATTDHELWDRCLEHFKNQPESD